MQFVNNRLKWKFHKVVRCVDFTLIALRWAEKCKTFLDPIFFPLWNMNWILIISNNTKNGQKSIKISSFPPIKRTNKLYSILKKSRTWWQVKKCLFYIFSQHKKNDKKSQNSSKKFSQPNYSRLKPNLHIHIKFN